MSKISENEKVALNTLSVFIFASDSRQTADSQTPDKNALLVPRVARVVENR